MKKSLRASFTVEITYIIFFIFMGIAFIIGYSIDKHTETVDSIEMHLLLERNINFPWKESREIRVSEWLSMIPRAI